MRIVFLNPPSLESRYINRDLMGGLGVSAVEKEGWSERLMAFFKASSIRLPVLSLVYSATIASREHDVTCIDAANTGLSAQETERRIEALNPDWLISTTSISALMAEAQLVDRLKRRLGCVAGLMGDAATQLSDQIFQTTAIDFIIRGDEPEQVVEQMVARQDFRVTGAIYRDDGSIRDGGDPGYIADLDKLPFPKWEMFPISSYRYFPILRRTPFVTMLSTRGCPYGCVYCPYSSNQGPKYRYRSAENVLDELTLLKEKYGIRTVQFRDPTFTIRKERTAAICRGMIERRLNLEWGCETRIDCLTEELLDVMVEAGLKGVNVGIESTAKEVIRNVSRGWIAPTRIEQIVTHMARRGVRVSGFFILGLPGETLDAIRETLKFAVTIPLSYAEFKIATPFPGTPLFDMAKTNGWIDSVQLEKYTAYTPSMVIPGVPSPGELTRAAKTAYRQFYMRPGKIVRELTSDSFLPKLMQIVLTSQ